MHGAIFGTVLGVWGTRTVGRLQAGVLAVALGAVVAPAAAAAAPPTAAFDMSRTVAEVGERVTFTDRSTDDGMIVRRGWDINGDGIITDQSGPRQVSRPYNEPGCVNIMLRVTDDAGDTSELIRVLTVVPKGAPRTPCPGATPNPPPPPRPLAHADPAPVPDVDTDLEPRAERLVLLRSGRAGRRAGRVLHVVVERSRRPDRHPGVGPRWRRGVRRRDGARRRSWRIRPPARGP